jgi:hypothetical protein
VRQTIVTGEAIMDNENDTDNGDTNDAKFLGVDASQFEIVVRALKGLRDEGKYTILLTRSGAIRIVGAGHDLHQALLDQPQTLDDKTTNRVLAEIVNYCQAAVFFKATKGVLSFLEQHIYGDAFEDKSDEEKAALREQLKKKVDLAIELLPPDAKQRQQRLNTATDACLEEIDVELVRERRDECSDVAVTNPFVRVRLRYTDLQSGDLFPWFFSGPWGTRPSAYKSFSVECDQVDIDVLLFRLLEAKQRLAAAIEKSSSGK